VARRDDSPDFIEAIARGLDVIRAFGPGQPVMSLAGVAAASDLPRPTARRILLTLEQLGYVRAGAGPSGSGYELTPRVLDLGMSYVLSRGRPPAGSCSPSSSSATSARPGPRAAAARPAVTS
jgi:IclR family transcriptional regulator, pca regulon regulatory protein